MFKTILSARQKAAQRERDVLSVQHLDGLTPAHCATLAEHGVTTIAMFRRIPKPVLVTAFGNTLGNALWRQARGLDYTADTLPRGDSLFSRLLSRARVHRFA